jgi:HK97 family phage portal protein
MLLEEGMKLEKIAIAPEESQFLESRQFQIPEIARWFNLPPHKLKDLTRSSFSNIESEQISFVTDSILPWLVRLEQAYTMQLLTPLEKRRLYYKHKVEGLMRGSSADRANFYARMWAIGVFSINDIRRLEDTDPVEGGDERFVPANMVPLARALQEPQPATDNEPPQGGPAVGLPPAPTNGKGYDYANSTPQSF